MAKIPPVIGSSIELKVLTGSVVGAIVVLCLYWAQAIFIPLILALYLSFLLGPLVIGLQQRHGLGRVPAVLGVVALLGIVLGSIGWMLTRQFSSLVEELPQYSGNVKNRINDLQLTIGAGPMHAIDRMYRELSGEMDSSPKPIKDSEEHDAAKDPNRSAKIEKPLPVAITPATPPWISRLPGFLGSVAEMLGALALTLVLTVFMLLKREDLRNRVIWLIGSGRLTHTTRAVDDATRRISKFFVRQAMINGGFGVVMAVGLFLIGVQYALLWGFFAALLRYIPYVGAVLAAIPPLLVSLAMSSGWLSPIFVAVLFAAGELTTGNAIEPRVFGQSLGVSEVALLVMSAFWAFLWGPIGLVLANPLTVCLVVMGKYVPHMEFFNVLLGDQPALSPDVSFYQRLYARDQDESLQLVDAHIKATSLDQVYDDLLIPALTMMKRDRERDELTEQDEEFIVQAMRELVVDLGLRRAKQAVLTAVTAPAVEENGAAMAKVKILACPARDAADELALEMLAQLLDSDKWELKITATEMLSAELVAEAERWNPGLICIAALPAGGLAHTRYLCKRLRVPLPETRILIGRWGLLTGIEQNQEQLREAGAEEMDTTILATRTRLTAWFGFLSQAAPAKEAAVAERS